MSQVIAAWVGGTREWGFAPFLPGNVGEERDSASRIEMGALGCALD